MMKKPIKLIMTDLDGTLLTDDKKVTERTREAIRKVKEQGVLFGIATGRAIEPVQILSKQWQIDDLIDVYIGYNGSQYYDVKEDYYESTDLLPGSCMEEIMDHLRKNNADCEFMIYLSKDFLVYTSGVTPEVERVARNNFFEIRVCDMKEFVRGKEYEKLLATCHKDYMPALMKIADTLPRNGYRVCTSTPNLMEFMDPVVSKTYGIEKVCRHRGFELEEVMVLGDASNDVEMLRDAGWGVCMINGTEDAKEVSKDITEYDNNQDGWAQYIEEYFEL